MDWIDAGTAAERLGVKPATLYAYVSRGVLTRRYDPDRRRSLFDPGEIEKLARRGKPRRRPAPTDIAIASSITALGTDRPYFRGRDAVELAASATFEAVAEWLWRADLTDSGPWRAPEEAVAAARAAQADLPAGVLPLDRLHLVVITLALRDPLRFHRDPATVVGIARALIAGMVAALPQLSAPIGHSVAATLWSRLSARPPAGDRELRILGAALILLADHELASSTFAARVAASVHADPYAVVSCGLGVLSGPMHGGASLAVERMFAETTVPSRVPTAFDDRLRRGERIPGAGHAVYRAGDARGTYLVDAIREIAPDHPAVAVAEAISTELRIRRLPAINSDFGLGVLATVFDMVPGAGETVFAVARTAGWLAHALEEYESGTLIRPRTVTPKGL
ncbi:citrate/2-methylcitrate synthase [Nocardia spumae]|uniref:citrate/2-methylcitrate synthase n=1 Tax=Nocardia spumae TaxID=2887190 RepID=UPI001D13B135|nr:citrate/2-methylcitrate synthase [Nocardia spumae]